MIPRLPFVSFAHFVVTLSLLACSCAATPPDIRWDVETSTLTPKTLDIRRGETITLTPRYLSHGAVLPLTNSETCVLNYRSADMSNGLYYAITGAVHNATNGQARVTWTAQSCPLATNLQADFVVLANGVTNLRAFLNIRLFNSVFGSAITSTNPTTQAAFDCAFYSFLNPNSAPWLRQGLATIDGQPITNGANIATVGGSGISGATASQIVNNVLASGPVPSATTAAGLQSGLLHASIPDAITVEFDSDTSDAKITLDLTSTQPALKLEDDTAHGWWISSLADGTLMLSDTAMSSQYIFGPGGNIIGSGDVLPPSVLATGMIASAQYSLISGSSSNWYGSGAISTLIHQATQYINGATVTGTVALAGTSYWATVANQSYNASTSTISTRLSGTYAGGTVLCYPGSLGWYNATTEEQYLSAVTRTLFGGWTVNGALTTSTVQVNGALNADGGGNILTNNGGPYTITVPTATVSSQPPTLHQVEAMIEHEQTYFLLTNAHATVSAHSNAALANASASQQITFSGTSADGVTLTRWLSPSNDIAITLDPGDRWDVHGHMSKALPGNGGCYAVLATYSNGTILAASTSEVSQVYVGGAGIADFDMHGYINATMFKDTNMLFRLSLITTNITGAGAFTFYAGQTYNSHLSIPVSAGEVNDQFTRRTEFLSFSNTFAAATNSWGFVDPAPTSAIQNIQYTPMFSTTGTVRGVRAKLCKGSLVADVVRQNWTNACSSYTIVYTGLVVGTIATNVPFTSPIAVGDLWGVVSTNCTSATNWWFSLEWTP